MANDFRNPLQENYLALYLCTEKKYSVDDALYFMGLLYNGGEGSFTRRKRKLNETKRKPPSYAELAALYS